MRAVWLGVPESFLEERRRLGLDKKDELWAGVIHMVPPPSSKHQRRTADLFAALLAIGKRRGLCVWGDTTGLFDPSAANEYRVPDLSLSRPDQVSHRGLEGAELVVEVLSPDDESREKLPFYARLGVREVWLLDPDSRAIEILSLRGGLFARVAPEDGRVTSPLLGIELVVGPLLLLCDGTERFEI